MSKHISELLSDILPCEHRWKISLLKAWPTIIGELKGRVILEKISKNSLVLAVNHSSWAQELYFLRPVLLQKVNALFDRERIKTIHIKTTDFSTIKKRTAGWGKKKGKGPDN